MGARKLTAVVVAGLLAGACSMNFEWSEDISYGRLNQTEEAGDEERLEARLELPVGTIEVEAGEPANAFEIDLKYNEKAFRPQVDFSREGKTARLRFALEGEATSFGGLGETRLNLRLNPETPLELVAETGVGESRLDLTGLKVESATLESGVGETELAMLRPNPVACDRLEVSSGVGSLEVIGLGNFGFRRFHFQGGVGATTLDFSGDWHRIGEVRIEVGVGGVDIRLPRDVGAEVRVRRSFLSSLDLPGFEKRGDTYYSRNRQKTGKVIKIQVSAGIGGIDFHWI